MRHRALIRDCVLLWAILVITGLVCRPLTPVDETRAVSVAWDMWLRGDFLVPYLNGEPYSHKPPLLQWLIHVGWLVFGVNEWTARLAAPLVGLGNLLLSAALARRLWPDRPAIAGLGPLILLTFPVWALWTTMTLYDMLVAFFSLLGLLGVLRAGEGAGRAGFGWVGLAIGGGVLSKGPVILLLILPVALLAPWWLEQRPARGWWSWYLGVGAAVLVGALLALAWAIPAGLFGGEEYRRAIFWGQSAGRIAHSFAHRRPWWWYLRLWPVLVLPWAFRISLWRGRPPLRLDQGLRFCLAHAVAVTALLSLVSGKQMHYILPVLPVAALVLARFAVEGSAHWLQWDQRLLGGLLIVLGGVLLVLPPLLHGSPDRPEAAFMKILIAAPLVARMLLIGFGLFLLFHRVEGAEAAVRAGAIALVGLMVSAHLIFRASMGSDWDLRPMAARLAEVEAQGAPVAYRGKHSGNFRFLGRLTKPFPVMQTGGELESWLRENPGGYVLLEYRNTGPAVDREADFAQSYRGTGRIGLWRAATLSGNPELMRDLLR